MVIPLLLKWLIIPIIVGIAGSYININGGTFKEDLDYASRPIFQSVNNLQSFIRFRVISQF